VLFQQVRGKLPSSIHMFTVSGPIPHIPLIKAQLDLFLGRSGTVDKPAQGSSFFDLIVDASGDR
jgi:hypothetical protein